MESERRFGVTDVGLTKETKVAGVDDGDGIEIPGQVIEGRQAAANVCDTQQPAVHRVEHLCLGVDLVGRARVGGHGGPGRRRLWSRYSLHFRSRGILTGLKSIGKIRAHCPQRRRRPRAHRCPRRRHTLCLRRDDEQACHKPR